MGQQAECVVRYQGSASKGRATLEHQDLIFRGDFRLVIPLRDVTAAKASDGVLDVKFRGESARFELGAAAARWAARIVNPPSLLQKLGVKRGATVSIVGVKEVELRRQLEDLDVQMTRAPAPASVDVIFYGANTRAALSKLKSLKRWLRPDGALWIVRPRGVAAITESDVMKGGKAAGLVDVKVVRFSDTHTAEKFMIPREARVRR